MLILRVYVYYPYAFTYIQIYMCIISLMHRVSLHCSWKPAAILIFPPEV